MTKFTPFVLWVAATAGNLRWLDLVGVATIVGFLLLGAQRGLWWQLVRLFGVIAAVAAARAVSPRTAPTLQVWFPDLSVRMAHGLVWLVVLGAGLLVVALVSRVGKSTIEVVALGPIDRLAGGLAGALSGACIHVAVVLVLCQVATREWSSRAIRDTRSQAVVETIGRNVPRLLDERAREALAAER